MTDLRHAQGGTCHDGKKHRRHAEGENPQASDLAFDYVFHAATRFDVMTKVSP